MAPPPPPFRLLLVTDRRALPKDGFLACVENALEAGVDAVQLREKDLGARALVDLGGQLRRLTRTHGAKLLVNDRIDVAMAIDADGVHLPEASFSPQEARRLLGPGALIGVSTHSVEKALAAAAAGTDYVVLGPIYETPSKREYGAPLGPTVLRQVANRTQVPIVAIGGITPERALESARQGAAGIAVISAILGAVDVSAATGALRSALRTALPY